MENRLRPWVSWSFFPWNPGSQSIFHGLNIYISNIYLLLLYYSSIRDIEHSPLYCTWFDTYPQSDLVTTNTLIIYIYISYMQMFSNKKGFLPLYSVSYFTTLENKKEKKKKRCCKVLHTSNIYINIYIHIKIHIHINRKVKLATVVKGDPKVPFSVATTLRYRGGHYSFPWMAPLYPWHVPYNAEC